MALFGISNVVVKSSAAIVIPGAINQKVERGHHMALIVDYQYARGQFFGFAYAIPFLSPVLVNSRSDCETTALDKCGLVNVAQGWIDILHQGLLSISKRRNATSTLSRF